AARVTAPPRQMPWAVARAAMLIAGCAQRARSARVAAGSCARRGQCVGGCRCWTPWPSAAPGAGAAAKGPLSRRNTPVLPAKPLRTGRQPGVVAPNGNQYTAAERETYARQRPTSATLIPGPGRAVGERLRRAASRGPGTRDPKLIAGSQSAIDLIFTSDHVARSGSRQQA